MFFETKEKAVEAVIKGLPYPHQITDIDLTKEDGAIRFTWRKTNKFRLDLTFGSVEEVGDGILMGSDIAILAQALIKGMNP